MNTQPKKLFQVGSQQVRARADAGLSGAMLKWLPSGTRLEADPNSRRELDGWVWWKHQEGWSAERNLDSSVVYLFEIAAAPVPQPAAPTPTPLPPTPSVPAAPTPVMKKAYQVGSNQVRVRDNPGLNSNTLKWLLPSTRIEVDVTTRRELDGFVWYRHAEGWTAERSLDGRTVFLIEPGSVIQPAPVPVNIPSSGILDVNTLPMRESLFKKLPVTLEETRWWQYFGNNVFAYNLWRDGTRWYAYAQGLHGGLDFGNSSTPGIQVRAGVEGTFIQRDTQYTKPNGMWVKVGDYTIIYGHLINPRPFNRGDVIGVDTVLGEFEFGVGRQNHLHLEVRYKDRYIMNPLLFMPDTMRTPIINKFRPDATYFYRDATWNQWQSPFDQPVLVMNGALIGPHAPR